MALLAKPVNKKGNWRPAKEGSVEEKVGGVKAYRLLSRDPGPRKERGASSSKRRAQALKLGSETSGEDRAKLEKEQEKMGRSS